MRLAPRRALLAPAAAVLLFPAGASAACQTIVCIDPPSHVESLVDVDVTPGDGSGVLCHYVEFNGPYTFVETQRWGDEHEDAWDWRTCPPQNPAELLCEPPLPTLPVCPRSD